MANKLKFAQTTPHTDLMQELAELNLTSQVRLCSSHEEDGLVAEFSRKFPSTFPHEGSAVYVPAGPRGQWDDYIMRAKKLLKDAVEISGRSCNEEIAVLWDQNGYPALSVPASLLIAHLDLFVSMPPHMYVIPFDVTWCVCYRMEGDMGYGTE